MAHALPALFLGHGNPMNAISRNAYSESWRRLGESLPRPKAVLCISAHWYVPALAVTANAMPPTIHDFGGFPEALYDVEYPAPGSLELALRVRELLAPLDVAPTEEWGLDHGAWSVLCHVYPKADVPVVQLSIDRRRPAAFHFELGQRLAALRDEGVLILGSGNLVHNLHAYAWGNPHQGPYDWAVRFEAEARGLIQTGAFAPLIDYASFGADGRHAIPTPDHYLPLLYVLGARREGEAVSFPVEGTEGGSISMLAVQVGV